MLIAEQILLLATDDETGKVSSWHASSLDTALAGGVLVDLVLRSRVDLDVEGRKGRVVVVDPAPTGEPILDGGLARLAAKPRKPADAVSHLEKGLRSALQESLAARGVLRRDEGRVLGIFPTTRWPAVDSSAETLLRSTLEQVLLAGQQPAPQVGAVVALLGAADLLGLVVDRRDLKAAKARAKELAAGDWASDGVRKAVEAANTAVMVAVMAATTASTASVASGS